MIKIATIAGFDASGGSGIESDLKTFEEYGLYGMAALTLIETMDSGKDWARSVFPVEENILRAQMDTIFRGVGVDAVKTGRLGSSYSLDIVAEYIKEFKISQYVFDPVMTVNAEGDVPGRVLNREMIEKLLPISLVVTPNLFEAGQIAEMNTPANIDEMKIAARRIYDRGAKNVFIKGGSKLEGQKSAVDLFYNGSAFNQVEGALIDTQWKQGAGSTVAAAIASGLAQGMDPYEAVSLAKKFITLSHRGSIKLNQWAGQGNPSLWRKGFN